MTPFSFQIRDAEPSDAASVAALIRTAFASITPPLVPTPSALRETAETVAGQIETGGGLLAEAEGVPVGALLWSERDGGFYVGRLSVHAAWRRRKVAQALLAAAEVEARKRGMPRMLAGVRLVLLGNRRLFAGAGFCETILHTHEGFDAPTWVDVEKPLG